MPHVPYTYDKLSQARSAATARSNGRNHRHTRRWVKVVVAFAATLVIATGMAAWLWAKATTIRDELNAASALIAPLKTQIANEDISGAKSTADRLRVHTSAAKQSTEDPTWKLASAIPAVGANFAAITEISQSADDVTRLGLTPLLKAFESLDWKKLVPSGKPANLEPMKLAAPSVASAAHAVKASSARLDEIDADGLLPQIADPLIESREQLRGVTAVLDASADASRLLPSMMGADAPRKYLLMIQNNAEVRASGGIPGAVAVLELDNGKLSLGAQSSASAMGPMSPVLAVDEVQQQIYSKRLGKFMQDVNLTPDFPTSARTAAEMWERTNTQRVDGVISIDPVALSYILEATGPVRISGPEIPQVELLGLPTELNGKNVVPTLLSDVYAKIEEPKLQDAYFASVAQEIFRALSTGPKDPRSLLSGISRGATESRISLWSAVESEQSLLSTYPLSGSISGPSVPAAQFGVYFNDGTGAKMDYYVKRSVKLIESCPREGYGEVTVRVTSTNTAPTDAATALPAYVTGNGTFGVPPGSVQTNIVAYGPVLAQIESAKVDGKKTSFAPYLHSNRPVGVLAIRLAPGESKTVEYTFGKIVQHAKPDLIVTPTVQPVKDVILPTAPASCG